VTLKIIYNLLEFEQFCNGCELVKNEKSGHFSTSKTVQNVEK